MYTMALSLALAGTLFGLPALCAANDADYPNRPIRLIVPYDAGGPADILARSLAREMAHDLQADIVIENKSGANSIIGNNFVAGAQADGYTLLVGTPAFAIHASYSADTLTYDTKRDFAPVARYALTPYYLIVNAQSPANSVAELAEHAASAGRSMGYGSSGAGSAPHLAGVKFAQATGTNWLHVPYRGTNPAIMALVADQVQMVFTGYPSVRQLVEGGRLKVLAVAADERVDISPDVPTLKESGLSDVRADAWFGILAPRGVPPAIRDRLAGAVQASLARPALQERFDALGAVPAFLGPEEFTAFIDGDIDGWAKAVATAGD